MSEKASEDRTCGECRHIQEPGPEPWTDGTYYIHPVPCIEGLCWGTRPAHTTACGTRACGLFAPKPEKAAEFPGQLKPCGNGWFWDGYHFIGGPGDGPGQKWGAAAETIKAERAAGPRSLEEMGEAGDLFVPVGRALGKAMAEYWDGLWAEIMAEPREASRDANIIQELAAAGMSTETAGDALATVINAYGLPKGYEAEAAKMMDEVAAVKDSVAVDTSFKGDAARFRWMLEGNGYFMEEQMLCGHIPTIHPQRIEARRKIDEAMAEDEKPIEPDPFEHGAKIAVGEDGHVTAVEPVTAEENARRMRHWFDALEYPLLNEAIGGLVDSSWARDAIGPAIAKAAVDPLDGRRQWFSRLCEICGVNPEGGA